MYVVLRNEMTYQAEPEKEVYVKRAIAKLPLLCIPALEMNVQRLIMEYSLSYVDLAEEYESHRELAWALQNHVRWNLETRVQCGEERYGEEKRIPHCGEKVKQCHERNKHYFNSHTKSLYLLALVYICGMNLHRIHREKADSALDKLKSRNLHGYAFGMYRWTFAPMSSTDHTRSCRNEIDATYHIGFRESHPIARDLGNTYAWFYRGCDKNLSVLQRFHAVWKVALAGHPRAAHNLLRAYAATYKECTRRERRLVIGYLCRALPLSAIRHTLLAAGACTLFHIVLWAKKSKP